MQSALFKVIGGLALVLAFSFLFSWPIYMLWNLCLVGAIDGVREIGWLQAWGIAILSGLLFKSGHGSNSKS